MLDPRQLTFIMDSLPALVSYINADGIYTYANHTYEEWFRRDLDSVVGRSFKEVLGPEKYQIVEEKVKRALAGETVEYEAFVQYEGGNKHVQASYIPDVDPDSGAVAGFIVLVQDITAPKSRALELDSQVRDLHQAKDQSEKTVSLFTHDMRSPLTSAKLSSELLLRNPGNEEKVRKYSERIKLSLERTDRQIRNLLDANRLQGGRELRTNLDDVDAVTVVRGVVGEFQSLFGDRFRFESEVEELAIFSDKSALQRSVDLLLSTSTKTNTAEEIEVRLEDDTDRFKILVVNSEEFIEKELLSTIFSDENHVNLSIVKGIAVALGGTLAVESNRKTGTTFSLGLPKKSPT